ncbi:MAG: peptide-N-glycosidase F-related protein [Myxococcota bacterium]|nr:peptide-N-glycosidase F-related protein [Myxococcota bacterium]
MNRSPLSVLLATALFTFTGCAAEEDTTASSSPVREVAPKEMHVSPHDFAQAAPWYSCPTESLPEGVITLSAFNQDTHSFGGDAGNLRKIESEVEFPNERYWEQVGMRLTLECPENGKCDHWDRSGSIQLVENPEAPAEEQTTMEIARHITPYRRGMCQYIDITPMASRLVGKQTLRSYIDTWVGPGHAQGEGWRISVEFVFYPGTQKTADEVISVWGRKRIVVGQTERDKTIEAQITPVQVTIPADATRVEAHLTTTGHSFGNRYNCAEFCEMRHDIKINTTTFSVNPWRRDCEQNPVSPQSGTWKYARNGWCPGAIAVGNILDITNAVTPGIETTVDFDIRLPNGEVYDNSTPVDLLPYTYTALRLYIYR